MSEFVEYLHEVFMEFGEIRSRKMFGGYGIYHQDRMFGLVADDELYLKVDKQSIHWFEEAGLEPFMYDKNGTLVAMSYHQAPETIYDDSGQACLWANRAFDAAARVKKPTRKK